MKETKPKKQTISKHKQTFLDSFPSGETIFFCLSFAIPRHGFILENQAVSIEKEMKIEERKNPSLALGSSLFISSR